MSSHTGGTTLGAAPTAAPSHRERAPAYGSSSGSVSSAAQLQSETARLLAALPPHLQMQMQAPTTTSSRTAAGGSAAPAPPSRPAPARPNIGAAAAAAATVAAGSAAAPPSVVQQPLSYRPSSGSNVGSSNGPAAPLSMPGFTSPLRGPQPIPSTALLNPAGLTPSLLAHKQQQLLQQQQQRNPDLPPPPTVHEWTKFRGGALSLNPPGGDLVSASSDSGDYPSMDAFNALPPEVQEQLLLEHVLYALLAIEGRYIRVAKQNNDAQHGQQQQQQSQSAPTRVHFSVDPGIRDASMVELVSRLLPAAGAYFSVQSYVQSHSRWEVGLVTHAFAAALRTILKEYLVLVAQLEFQFASRKLTLLRAWYYIQPALHSLTRLEHLCVRASKHTGGALLNVLHGAMSAAGDAATKDLYAHLLSAAAVPYFSMLRSWLTQGALADPYDEFQVRADQAQSKENVRRDFNDTYWDERYTVRNAQLPSFLREVSEKILTTGKYLNVIRECGREIPMDDVLAAASGSDTAVAAAGGGGGGGAGGGAGVLLSYSPNDRDYTDPIDRLYTFASRLLLRLLLDESDLLGRLRSIKSFFLFAQGDFYTHWMDLCAEELSKRSGQIVPQKLASLLQLAVKSTKAAQDPYADDLSCHLQQYSLVQKLEAIHNTATASAASGTSSLKSASGASGGAGGGAGASAGGGLHGYDSVTLAYRVSWPLSLVLSKKTLTKYQLIFRHLFSIRHTERLLHGCWANHQTSKGLELGRAYHASFALRHRMLHLFHSLAYYIMAEVLEPNWHRLETELVRVSTVDQVLRLHASFLDTCLKQCLLTNQALLKSIQKLIVTARHFAEHAELTMNSGTAAAAARRAGGGGGAAGGLGLGLGRGDSDEEGEAPRHRRTGSMDEMAERRAPPTLQQRADSIAFHTRVTLAAVADPRHQATIAAHCAAFDDNLFALLAQLKAKSQQGSDAHFSNLYQRLDYNDWYAAYFKNQQAAAAAQKAHARK